jgi:peptide/nickel transport system substrate-binding protein
MGNTSRAWAVAVALAVVLSIIGSPDLRASSAQRTDVLVIAKDISDIRSPDPAKAYEVSSAFLLYPLYSRLVRQEAPDYGKIQPDLAESWTISPDASTYTFKLRKGAVFSTGNPVTSEDVRFSLLRLKYSKGPGGFLADPIKSVEAVDPSTARVVLTGPDATFLAALAAQGFSILDSKTIRAQGGVDTVGADTLDKAESWFFSHSAGSGPYILERFTRESEIVYRRNDQYFGTKPFFRQVIVRHVKDAGTEVLLLQRGDVDLALDLGVDQVAGLKGNPRIKAVEGPSAFTVYVGMNTAVAPWNNPKVRAAVKYAIDYDAIVSEIMRGHGQRIGSIMMPGMLGFPESLNKAILYPHDAAKAAALMKEAGVARASVAFTWPSGANYATLPVDRLAQKLRADLLKIGVDLKLQPVQESVFLPYFRAGKPETILAYWFPDFLDPDNWTILVNGLINKRFHWQSPEALKLVDEAKTTADEQGREALYERYNRLLAGPDTPYVFLVQPSNVIAARDDIAGVRYHSLYSLEIDSLRRQ